MLNTKENYFICFVDETLVMSYTLCCSPAVSEAIDFGLKKIEKANIIEPFKSPYSAKIVCLRIPMDHFE